MKKNVLLLFFFLKIFILDGMEVGTKKGTVPVLNQLIEHCKRAEKISVTLAATSEEIEKVLKKRERSGKKKRPAICITKSNCVKRPDNLFYKK